MPCLQSLLVTSKSADFLSPGYFVCVSANSLRYSLCIIGIPCVVYVGFCLGNMRERDHLEDPGVDGRIILRWIFRKGVEKHGLD